MEYKNVKQVYPECDATETVRVQVRRATVGVQARQQRARRVRGTVLGALATILLVGGGAVVGPVAYANYRIQLMDGAVADCQTAALHRFRIMPDGKAEPSGSIYYSQGKWRLEDPENVQVHLYREGSLWLYYKDMKQAVKSSKPDGPFGFNPSGFSVKAMIADHARWQWKEEVTLGSETLDGKNVETVTFDDGRYRSKIYADPDTHMPMRASTFTLRDGQWKELEYQTFEFNKPLDEKLFAVTFPPDVRVTDADKLKSDWAKKLEKPIAILKAKSATIAIRDIAINERGHIFIVFTDGETLKERMEYVKGLRGGNVPTSWRVTPEWRVTDSLGTVYWPALSGLQPFTTQRGEKASPWIVLKDGQIPQGAWLIPSKDSRWAPRKLTFIANIQKGGEENFNWPGELTTSWSLEVKNPNSPLVPIWAPACATSPRTAKAVLDREKSLREKGGMENFIPVQPKG